MISSMAFALDRPIANRFPTHTDFRKWVEWLAKRMKGALQSRTNAARLGAIGCDVLATVPAQPLIGPEALTRSHFTHCDA